MIAIGAAVALPHLHDMKRFCDFQVTCSFSDFLDFGQVEPYAEKNAKYFTRCGLTQSCSLTHLSDETAFLKSKPQRLPRRRNSTKRRDQVLSGNVFHACGIFFQPKHFLHYFLADTQSKFTIKDLCTTLR